MEVRVMNAERPRFCPSHGQSSSEFIDNIIEKESRSNSNCKQNDNNKQTKDLTPGPLTVNRRMNSIIVSAEAGKENANTNGVVSTAPISCRNSITDM